MQAGHARCRCGTARSSWNIRVAMSDGSCKCRVFRADSPACFSSAKIPFAMRHSVHLKHQVQWLKRFSMTLLQIVSDSPGNRRKVAETYRHRRRLKLRRTRGAFCKFDRSTARATEGLTVAIDEQLKINQSKEGRIQSVHKFKTQSQCKGCDVSCEIYSLHYGSHSFKNWIVREQN